MTLTNDLKLMVRWNIWANDLVVSSLAAADTAPPKALAAVRHIFEAELAWLRRMAGVPNPNVPLWDIASATDLATFHAESNQHWAWILEKLTEQFLESHFSYRNSKGVEYTDQVELPLLHTFLHSQQYRGEAAGLLAQADIPVPDFDFIFWLREFGETR